MSKHQAGKGDTPRPLSVSKKEFNENFERIFGSEKERKQKLKDDSEEDDGIFWPLGTHYNIGSYTDELKAQMHEVMKVSKEQLTYPERALLSMLKFTDVISRFFTRRNTSS